MVLVILGTQDKSFVRLLDMVNNLVIKGVITEEVIVQNGYTKYNSDKMKMIGFVSPSKMKKYIKDANYVISHGGVGSILDSLKLGKKVIAIPRLSEFGEHHNDHQKQIISEFTKMGFILDGSVNLEKSVKSINKFKPNKYTSNQSNFINLIEHFISKN